MNIESWKIEKKEEQKNFYDVYDEYEFPNCNDHVVIISI